MRQMRLRWDEPVKIKRRETRLVEVGTREMRRETRLDEEGTRIVARETNDAVEGRREVKRDTREEVEVFKTVTRDVRFLETMVIATTSNWQTRLDDD